MIKSLKAILFDLDGTLLDNNIQNFLEGYLPLIAAYIDIGIDKGTFVSELIGGTQAMIGNIDPALTNQDVFWAEFSKRTGFDQAAIEPDLSQFYQEEFRKLKPITRRIPQASQIVRNCIDMGYKVVVATNPLFPISAIEQRLAWAGLPVSEYSFSLVTSYENMHATKPNSEYYREILTRIGVQADESIMVGDDWQNDILPAAKAGLFTFWITDSKASPAEDLRGLRGTGSLEEFDQLLRKGFQIS